MKNSFPNAYSKWFFMLFVKSFEPSIEERIKNVQGTLGLDSGLQETLDTFKEIQKDPQLLFQTLRGMEHQKQDNEKVN